MKLIYRHIPVGALPYKDIQSCKKMMLRLYEQLPFLPELPLIDKNDDVVHRTLGGLPCISEKDGKFLLPEGNSEAIAMVMIQFEKILKSNDVSQFDIFGIDAPFMSLYEAMLEKFKPEHTIVNLIGPFSFANMIFNRKASDMLTDRMYRKYIEQAITCKALWFVYKIKSISPKTVPIIMFDEKFLFKFGTIKRTNEYVTNNVVTGMFIKVFERLKKEGALIGVQSFEKCNWQLVFDTNLVDIISFDSYNNPNNLNILAHDVNKFLAGGGLINWGMIPVMNENSIRFLNLDQIYLRFIATLENLASSGVSADLLYKNCTVSVQGELIKYPILFAEKAMMIAEKLGKKIPNSSGSIQN